MFNNLNDIKIQKEGIFTKIFLVIFVIIYSYFVNFYGMGNDISNWRYYIFAGVTILSFCVFLLKNRNNIKNMEGKEIKYIIITSLVFFVVSLYKCNKARVKLPFRFFVQTSLILLPCSYAYILKNTLSFKSIIEIMKIITVITIVFYFLEPKHPISSFFDINNYLNISLLHSKSFTESHNYFDTFFQLFLFFNYFGLKVTDYKTRKSLKKYMIITLIFTIMSFKRLGLLYTLIIIISKRFINYDKKTKINSLIFASCFTVLTVIYVSILQGNIFNLTYNQLFNLTSGRNWVLSLWEEKGYMSYGYGSSMLFIGKYLEMDLPQIYLELNSISLFIFIYSFFKLAGNKLYSILIMIYVMTNMLTSSSLPWSIGWIVMFLDIMCITSEKTKLEYDNLNKNNA